MTTSIAPRPLDKYVRFYEMTNSKDVKSFFDFAPAKANLELGRGARQLDKLPPLEELFDEKDAAYVSGQENFKKHFANKMLSRSHATIRWQPTQLYPTIVDSKSTHGTFIMHLERGMNFADVRKMKDHDPRWLRIEQNKVTTLKDRDVIKLGESIRLNKEGNIPLILFVKLHMSGDGRDKNTFKTADVILDDDDDDDDDDDVVETEDPKLQQSDVQTQPKSVTVVLSDDEGSDSESDAFTVGVGGMNDEDNNHERNIQRHGSDEELGPSDDEEDDTEEVVYAHDTEHGGAGLDGDENKEEYSEDFSPDEDDNDEDEDEDEHEDEIEEEEQEKEILKTTFSTNKVAEQPKLQMMEEEDDGLVDDEYEIYFNHDEDEDYGYGDEDEEYGDYDEEEEDEAKEEEYGDEDEVEEYGHDADGHDAYYYENDALKHVIDLANNLAGGIAAAVEKGGLSNNADSVIDKGEDEAITKDAGLPSLELDMEMEMKGCQEDGDAGLLDAASTSGSSSASSNETKVTANHGDGTDDVSVEMLQEKFIDEIVTMNALAEESATAGVLSVQMTSNKRSHDEVEEEVIEEVKFVTVASTTAMVPTAINDTLQTINCTPPQKKYKSFGAGLAAGLVAGVVGTFVGLSSLALNDSSLL